VAGPAAARKVHAGLVSEAPEEPSGTVD